MNEEFHHDRADDMLSTQEVARMCNVTTYTVRKWITQGKLRAVKLGDGQFAHLRIRRGDALNMLRGRPM